MIFRVPKEFIYQYSERILREADTDYKIIEEDLESLVYESGERNWEEMEDENGLEYFVIDMDIE